MKSLLMVILMLLVLPKTGGTKEITPGQIFQVPAWSWVDIIKTSTTSRDTCGIEFGDQVRVLAVEDKVVLVKYERKISRTGVTPCINGIMFLINTDDLKKFASQHRTVVKKKQERRSLINRLILKSRLMKEGKK